MMGNAQAGITFAPQDRAMQVVTSNRYAVLGDVPLEAGLAVCIAIAVRGKGLIHLLPVMSNENGLPGESMMMNSVDMIKKYLDAIGYKAGDEVHVIYSQRGNYMNYGITPSFLELLVPKATYVMQGDYPRIVRMTNGSLWYEENGKDVVVYGTGSTVFASSEPVKGRYKGRIY